MWDVAASSSPNVRFAPKATELLRRREMTQRANKRHARQKVRENFKAIAYSVSAARSVGRTKQDRASSWHCPVRASLRGP
jgi:hypothetical protein